MQFFGQPFFGPSLAFGRPDVLLEKNSRIATREIPDRGWPWVAPVAHFQRFWPSSSVCSLMSRITGLITACSCLFSHFLKYQKIAIELRREEFGLTNDSRILGTKT